MTSIIKGREIYTTSVVFFVKLCSYESKVDRIQGTYSDILVYNPGKSGLAHPIPVETTPTIIA